MAGWLTAAGHVERAVLAVVALAAALALLFRVKATERPAAHEHDAPGATVTRGQARPRTRRGQRLVALQLQISDVQVQLDKQAQTLTNLAQRLGQADSDAGERLTQLANRVVELETVAREQRAVLGRHLPRLRQAIAAHQGTLADLERSLEGDAPGAAP